MRRIERRARAACAAALLLVVLAGCEQHRPAREAEPQAQAAKAPAWLKSELYFGRTKPVGEVSAAEWEAFLAEEVTPRFPDGLTVLDAYGQWRNADGKIGKESTKLLVLVHPDEPAAARKIGELIEVYKKRFTQESVLWVKHPVEVKF
ncbi:MAG: DUF3574 domain-containing protein [Planctomycetes bacterium]|nr:DUF3574 domain-containing protein [Planctomycetota bacterium]